MCISGPQARAAREAIPCKRASAQANLFVLYPGQRGPPACAPWEVSLASPPRELLWGREPFMGRDARPAR